VSPKKEVTLAIQESLKSFMAKPRKRGIETFIAHWHVAMDEAAKETRRVTVGALRAMGLGEMFGPETPDDASLKREDIWLTMSLAADKVSMNIRCEQPLEAIHFTLKIVP
jgi:hypothetical protein